MKKIFIILMIITATLTFAVNKYIDNKEVDKIKKIYIGKKENKDEVIKYYEIKNLEYKNLIDDIDGLLPVKLKKTEKYIVLQGKLNDVNKIIEVLNKVDIEKKQILVKANIIETSSNLLNRLGFDWKIFKSNDINILNFINNKLSFSSLLNMGGNFLGVDIDTLKENGELSIKSTPSILVYENVEGEIKITDEIVITKLVNSNDKKPYIYEAGLILKIKPSIIKNDFIKLEIYTEMSNLKGNSGKQKSQITTTLLIKDGSSSFVGGVNQKSERFTESKVAILGDIPVFGNIFRKKSKTKEKRDIILEIEAKIIK